MHILYVVPLISAMVLKPMDVLSSNICTVCKKGCWLAEKYVLDVLCFIRFAKIMMPCDIPEKSARRSVCTGSTLHTPPNCA